MRPRPPGAARRRGRDGSVEQLGPERLALPVMMIAVVVARRLAIALAIVVVVAAGEARRALDELVQLTAVQPDAAALRTEVDFDSLTIADHQVHLTPRALHTAHGSCETAPKSTTGEIP